MATLERSPCGTVWVSASMPSSQPCSSARVSDELAGLVAVEAVEVGELLGGADALPEGGVVLERDASAGVHHVDRGEAVRAGRPSQSLKSWAGVILTAPVPFAGSA